MCLGVFLLFLAGCGGGSSDDGGFGGADPQIQISISADRTTLPANINGFGPDLSLPFINTFTVRVVDVSGRLFPAEQIAIDLIPSLANGALFFLDGDPEHEDENGNPLAFRRLVFEDTTGIVTGHFLASEVPGTVTLVASATDLNGITVSASVDVTVEGVERPVASLDFGGAFIDAVLAGMTGFGGGPTPNGIYSRVVSVVASDASGNPVTPNTPIFFFVIDSPIVGYPNQGAGSFFVSDDDGDPLENDFLFNAVNGRFVSRGVRSLDRLVLDGRQIIPVPDNPLPDNRHHTGIRTVETVLGENSLFIDQGGPAFNAGPDNGGTVPYVIGRAQHATINSPTFTDLTGTASTILNYPTFRVGQTAILVACTGDFLVCTVLNTCNTQGTDCDPVFLGALESDPERPRIFTTSAPSSLMLGPNTAVDVEFCVRDPNFTPVPVEQITYSISSNRAAVITVNGSPADVGTLLTRGDGCVTATIAATGQIAGSDDITVRFTTDGAEPIELMIVGPGAGNLTGTITRTATGATVSLRLIDNNGRPIPDTFINHTTDPQNVDNQCTSMPPRSDIPAGAIVTYDPATQVTDAEGRLTAFIEFFGDAGDMVTITFATVSEDAEFAVTLTNNEPKPICPTASDGTS